MSKKGGTIIKIVAVVAGVAAAGTACYVYKDKIKEFFEKIELKEKFESAKTFITEKLQANKGDDFFDDADFFEDEDTVEAADSGNRGYTPINITPEGNKSSEDSATSATSKQSTAPNVTGISNSNEETDTFEYEGLSDTSEDEDVLAEEAAIDGNA